MKKFCLTVGLLAAALTSEAHVIWGSYAGHKKIKGTLVVTCKNSSKVCVYVAEVEDPNTIIVTVKDVNGATVLEEAYASAGITATPNSDDSTEYAFNELP